MPTPVITHIPFRKPALTDLRNGIKDLVYTYNERISLAEAIGILEIVKQELLEEHK